MSGAHYRKWNGPKISDLVKQNVARALGKFGLVAEGESKKELQKGHGVETGTLRRSIHTAGPDYDWQKDNVPPSNSTPELGAQNVQAAVEGNRISLLLGSGLIYALPVHQGHHSFAGYHYLTHGVDKAKPQLPDILEEFKLK